MTATEELRQLLDERGVEWRRTPHYSSESMDNETVFCGIGIEWMASDHLNGRLGLRALKYEVTPEQAVEATLGRGTLASMPDQISHPSHYGEVEPWDFEPKMPSSGSPFVDHLRMAAVEYIWRAPLKGGVTDLEKAANVLEKAADYARGGLS